MHKKDYKLYHGIIDLSIKNNSHTQVFLFLQEHCELHGIQQARILEIGCNTGYFSQLLTDAGHEVYGIEPFSDAALKQNCVKYFFGGTIEDFFSSETKKEWPLFDAVILGDVLEHLVNPEWCLVQLGELLAPGGVLLISVPNITHISIRHMLEDGEWLYKKYGLLDETHKYFFSQHSLRKMLVKTGFGIERLFQVLALPIEEYAQTLFHAPIDMSKLTKRDHTFQIVVRASKEASLQDAFIDELPKNILLLSTGAAVPSSILRLMLPLQHYCKKIGGSLRVLEDKVEESLQWADIVVCHRECTEDMLAVLRLARSRGISVVYDLDDLLFELPSWLSSRSSHVMRQVIRHIAATADIVTCATKPLCEELKKLTDKVAHVPNVTFEKHDLDLAKIHNDSEPCSLVLASSDTVQLGSMKGALDEFFRRNPQHKLVVIGEIAASLKDSGLTFTTVPHCSPQTFSRVLLSLHNAVGLIPLDGSLFSSCKSAIKYYHYAMSGVVSVASRVLPYAIEIEHGKSGLLVNNTPEDWLQAMEKACSSASLRRRLLAKAIHYCTNHASPTQSLDAWEKAFRGLPRPGRFGI